MNKRIKEPKVKIQICNVFNKVILNMLLENND